MIVKNEEKRLGRCLDAIKPILDNVDSELIITDTGSSDNTVEIARKYTNNVIHFDWIDDFSAARNFGLEKAQGDWFMYLDADDIFETCNGIIDFFNSGEYKNYNSASYIGKNIVDNDGHFALNKQPRLTKILKNTKFKNVVHEVFTTYGAPKKDINDIAVHYGYLYESDEQKKKKTARNRELLLKRLEKEKNISAFIYVQLAENESDEDEALKYIEAGIKNAKRLSDISIIPLLKHKSNLYLLKKDYEKSLTACNDYFRLDKTYRPSVLSTDMEILAMKAWDHYCLKQYDDAVKTYISFFDVFERVKSGEINTADADIVMVQVASESNYLAHFAQFIDLACKTGQFELADKYIRSLDISSFKEGASHIDRLIDREITVLDHFDFAFTEYYIDKFDGNERALYIEKLKRLLFYTNKKEAVLRALDSVKESSEMVELLKRYFNGEQLPVDSINKYMGKSDPAAVMIAMSSGMDISPFLENESQTIKKCVEDGYRYYYGFNKAADNYDVSAITNVNSLNKAAHFYVYCMNETISFKSPKPGVFVIIDSNKLLERFAEIGIIIRGKTDSLDSDYICEAAIIVGRALEKRRDRKFKECISELKNAIGVCGTIAKFVSDYSKEVVQEYDNFIKDQKHNTSEMDRLALMIKNNIRKYIETGNISAAEKTLNDYRSIAPYDPDIAKIEAEINLK